jgi:hypothetical protein
MRFTIRELLLVTVMVGMGSVLFGKSWHLCLGQRNISDSLVLIYQNDGLAVRLMACSLTVHF